MHWVQLVLAILFETFATSALKASEGFTRPVASVLCAVAYGVSFYMLSLALKVVPVGVAYAIWAGTGVVLISIAGVYLFKQRIDGAGMVGIGLIVAGVVVLNVFSKTSPH